MPELTPQAFSERWGKSRLSENKKRTRTNLYNQRPTWLDNALARLHEAVFVAYRWPADHSDEEVLQNLLALNLERSTVR